MRVILIFFFSIIFSQYIFAQNKDFESFDSIQTLRDLANNKSLGIEKQLDYARLAVKMSKNMRRDSTILASNRVLSYLFLINNDIDSLYSINHKDLKLAAKLNDTLKMGYISHNLGYYFDEIKNKLDSAYNYYYKARKFYRLSNKKKLEADVLSNMARIQRGERDFIGSEINAIEGIRILEKLPKNDHVYGELWKFNNLIGIISGQIGRYDKAIEYHNKALVFSKKIKDDYLLNLYSKTNIAILYRRKGDYNIANKEFLKILTDKSIKNKDPSTYSSLLSSLAYCKLLNNEKQYNEIEALFREALETAKNEKDNFEIMNTSEHFSEYFLKINKKDSASYYANLSYNLAKELIANQTILNTLILKSKIEVGDSSKKYLYKHIKLNDSLVLAERSIRNKFARINLETDKIRKERNQFSKQNEWLIITSIALLVTLFFLYIIKSQREKNKELQLAQQQQEANEEIYNLMLSQQDKMDEARAAEKQRISQELHDGILGRLFGARLSLDSLNLSKTEEAVANRGNYINELKVIEQDIRKVSHDLNTDFIAHSGFLDIIETLVETQTLAYNLKSSIKADQDINWDAISNKTKIHFYRIIQESLQNIYKHANATRVDILFKQQNNLISLAIKDDGSGFDENKTKKGIGLKNMKSRVKEIKGVLNIQTKATHGTTIEIRVPN